VCFSWSKKQFLQSTNVSGKLGGLVASVTKSESAKFPSERIGVISEELQERHFLIDGVLFVIIG